MTTLAKADAVLADIDSLIDSIKTTWTDVVHDTAMVAKGSKRMTHAAIKRNNAALARLGDV
jgi:hypothetical protein